MSIEKALAQVSRCRATVGGVDTPTFVALSDRTNPGRHRPWDERLTWALVATSNGNVTIVGL